MTEEEADRLLRSDLMKLCKMFSGYGQDSLLLATLAYNVGAYRLLGYDDRPKSRLIQILDEGDWNIYREYITFRKYKGKIISSLELRRRMELELLYIP
jgi:GH24 family phage-related lysozyme (muramidase)